jgi:hypothetical protein
MAIKVGRMKIGLVTPPFISVPPPEYGGTELFIAHFWRRNSGPLAWKVTVYTNGESTVEVDKRWLYEKAQWPVKRDAYAPLKDIDHTNWAVRDALDSCDVLHLHNAPGLTCSRLCRIPFVYTLHHPTDQHLSESYARFPEVDYVCISHDQRRREHLAKLHTILREHGPGSSKV